MWHQSTNCGVALRLDKEGNTNTNWQYITGMGTGKRSQSDPKKETTSCNHKCRLSKMCAKKCGQQHQHRWACLVRGCKWGWKTHEWWCLLLDMGQSWNEQCPKGEPNFNARCSALSWSWDLFLNPSLALRLSRNIFGKAFPICLREVIWLPAWMLIVHAFTDGANFSKCAFPEVKGEYAGKQKKCKYFHLHSAGLNIYTKEEVFSQHILSSSGLVTGT